MKFYIVKGEVTADDAWDGAAKIGAVEWQFSDGLAGTRSTSLDFLSLEQGLKKVSEMHPGCTFAWDPLNV